MKVNISLISIVIALSVFTMFFSCQQEKHEIKRPHQPWVFRSVLDSNPRMITLALHDNLWLAYSTQSCRVYKAWKGGVTFDGAVYTTVHGPQPSSEGQAFLREDINITGWRIIRNDSVIIPGVHYRGHRLTNGHASLDYHLKSENAIISVVEQPEYLDGRPGTPGLARKFTLTGVPAGWQVALVELNKKELSANNISTDGQWLKINDLVPDYEPAPPKDTDLLLLNTGSSTSLKYFFTETSEKATKADVEAYLAEQNEQSTDKGKTLISQNDCLSCHNEEVKTVGPSYLAIAEKYSNQESAIKRLTNKILLGGTGVWGETPMTAHPDLSEENAKSMVKYILSLDNEEFIESPAPIADNLNLDKPSIPLEVTDNQLVDKDDNSQSQGLAANLYLLEDFSVPIEDMTANTKPVLTGIAKAAHLTSENEFGGFSSNIFLELRGYITIPETAKYDFRLVSDDGSRLLIDGNILIDNEGMHSSEAKDGEITLSKGKHDVAIDYYQGGGGASLSLQWAKYGDEEFSIIPENIFSHQKNQQKNAVAYVPKHKLLKSIPGDQQPLTGVHPSFDLDSLRPEGFEPKVGGMDFLSDGSLILSTWDAEGHVYKVEGVSDDVIKHVNVKQIAGGLAEPLGVKVVDDEIYVLQKQELTKLIDNNGDDVIDEYQTICNGWKVSANFHEFAFGLAYKDGYFYASLATAIEPGGASTFPQIPDRGKVIKINKENGSHEFIAHGLRTPNGVNLGLDDEIFVSDNQGDWLPVSKIVHIQENAFYGSRSVDFEGTEGVEVTHPLAWLPQNEICNSPTQPAKLEVGPYKGQMLLGELTLGGIKRLFIENINGKNQAAVFRFTQGLEAGVNRLVWGPNGSLFVGGIGAPGNWGQEKKLWYGLERMTYNGKSTFEMLKVKAKTNGFHIEFTMPIAPLASITPATFEASHWYYEPTADYGGPKKGVEKLTIKNVSLSEDRKSVYLEIDGLKPLHVAYLRIAKPFVSESDQSLWTTETWYTMNSVPQNDYVSGSPVQQQAQNTLSSEEKAAGWELLFDGKTTNGWRSFKKESIGSAWKVINGNLILDTSNKKDWQIKNGGDIITNEEFENYELTLEWKIDQGGNSGIIYNVVEDEKYDYVWQTGPEMQILDNVGHADGRIVTHRAADLYDMIECSFVAANPALEWNKIRLISNNGHVEHWINGYKVVEFEMHNDTWTSMIANSKFKDMPDFGLAKKGHLALQDHGDRVWFRNIKIKRL